MSRQEVRSAVTTFMAGQAIPNLIQVHKSFPKTDDFDWSVNSAPGAVSKCIGVVFIQSESEQRISTGGGVAATGADNGWKQLNYMVELQLFFRSWQDTGEDAMDDFDTIIEACKGALRSGGHRLGLTDGTVIWQAAEPSIAVTYGMPMANTVQEGAIDIWAAMRFTVVQMVTA